MSLFNTRKLAFCVVAVIVAAVCLSVAAAAATSYYNVSNKSFATVSNGPQNAFILSAGQTLPAAKTRAVSDTSGAAPSVSRYERQIDFYRRAGLIKPDQDIEVDQTVITKITVQGSLGPIKSRGRAGGGSINFVVDPTTWSAADKQLLEGFVSLAYPAIVNVYGLPAQTMTVTVVRDDTLIDRDWFTGGVLELPGNVIRLPRYGSNKSLERGLLHLMVHAFHGQARFNYDAWEEGFSRAACVAIAQQLDPTLINAGYESLDFTSDRGDAFYYLMPTYDLLNQPGLGNNTFLTRWTESIADSTARFGGMLIPRLGMSSTAWLKVYIEALKNGVPFFSRFNDAYYAAWSQDNNVAGNVPKLKEIAATVTPDVEGLAFADWYKRQYVLDTSVTNGKKLYAYVVPVTPDEASPEHYTVYVFLMHYITSRTGDEQPISGSCFPVFWDYQYAQDIWLGSQYEEIDVSDGEGYSAPTFTVGNMGGPQRMAMDFTMNDVTNRVLIAVGYTGTAAAENTLYGVVAGAATGTLNYQVDMDPSQSMSVSQGGFGATDDTASLGWSAVTMSFTGDNRTVTRKINKGPGRYAVVLDALDSVKTLPASFTKGWYMFSVPGTTLEPDQAAALGLTTGSLLLARWQPDMTADYKYMMYPTAPPFRPGWGYWLKVTSAFSSNIALQAEDQSAPWRIGLMPGWNMIGCPFLSSVNVSDIQVEVGNNDPMTYSDARADGTVGPIFGYDRTGSSYIYASTLDPLQGYWIKCNNPAGAVLTVPGPEATQ